MLFVWFPFVFFSFFLLQDKEPKKFTCRNSVILELATPKLVDVKESQKTEWYREGYFSYISYSDRSHIFVHCGFMVKRPFLVEEDFVVLENNISNKGHFRKGYKKSNNLFWREDFYAEYGVTIAYKNIKEENLSIFDKSLSNIIFKK